MTLFGDEDGFDVAIGRAAGALGDLDPSFVEKDYWVTQVLRVLQTEYPGDFFFKGGTSLSKGYDIIERFSEDVDILVVPLAGASIREGEAHLRAITGASQPISASSGTRAARPAAAAKLAAAT
jgi:Nucleotidyl transferase AbiEii toxin, Type IV TA system